VHDVFSVHVVLGLIGDDFGLRWEEMRFGGEFGCDWGVCGLNSSTGLNSQRIPFWHNSILGSVCGLILRRFVTGFN
jgi:hypothetical protein